MQNKKPLFFLIFSLLFSLLLITPPAWSLSLGDICTADIPVANNSHRALQTGLNQALNQVLVKVSGNASVMTLPAIENALPKVNDYVESYSYVAQTNPQGQQNLVLHVVFDNKAIQQILQNAGQTIWGANRPLTLIWIAIPQGTQATVLASDGNHSMMEVIKHSAMIRGIPIIFPEMDLEDQTDVAQTTATLPANDQLQQIAKKYGVGSLLAATIIDSNTQPQGEWRLILNGTPYEWQTSGTDINQVITNGIDRAADMMMNQLATIGGKNLQNTVVLQINDVKNLDDYVHAVAELKKLTPVAEVSVSDMSDNTLLLQVKTIGNADELISALKNSSHFVANTTPSTNSTIHADLFYRWVTTTS